MKGLINYYNFSDKIVASKQMESNVEGVGDTIVTIQSCCVDGCDTVNDILCTKLDKCPAQKRFKKLLKRRNLKNDKII